MLEHVLVGIMAIACWELLQYARRRAERPYRWSCPKCAFALEASDKLGYQVIKDNHLNHHEYGK